MFCNDHLPPPDCFPVWSSLHQSVVSVDFQNAIPWAKRERGFSPNRPFGPFCEKRTPLRERSVSERERLFPRNHHFAKNGSHFVKLAWAERERLFPRNHYFPRNHHFEGKSPAIVILNITVSEPWALLTHKDHFGPILNIEPWANRERFWPMRPILDQFRIRSVSALLEQIRPEGIWTQTTLCLWCTLWLSLGWCRWIFEKPPGRPGSKIWKKTSPIALTRRTRKSYPSAFQNTKNFCIALSSLREILVLNLRIFKILFEFSIHSSNTNSCNRSTPWDMGPCQCSRCCNCT